MQCGRILFEPIAARQEVTTHTGKDDPHVDSLSSLVPHHLRRNRPRRTVRVRRIRQLLTAGCTGMPHFRIIHLVGEHFFPDESIAIAIATLQLAIAEIVTLQLAIAEIVTLQLAIAEIVKVQLAVAGDMHISIVFFLFFFTSKIFNVDLIKVQRL